MSYELTTEQRLDDLDRRVNGLVGDLRDVRRQKPVRGAPAIYFFCALAALWAAKVGLDNGKVWEILLAFMFFAGWGVKAAASWQNVLNSR